MTRLLASVQDGHEAEIALNGGADIIDFKDARVGALGALDPNVIAAALPALHEQVLTSATAGDWPLDPVSMTQAVMSTAATGVDYIKIGLLPGADLLGCIMALAPAATQYRLVAVFFADRGVPLEALRHLHIAGFAGAMIDTFDKRSGGLRQHMSDRNLKTFIAAARDCELYTGLAGSLRADDIDALVGLAPHLLGFRGALCKSSDRGGALSAERLRKVRAALDGARAAHPDADVDCPLAQK
jgi:(5-formylfuran-3-yl)methyl phosphate synthase